MRTSHYWLSTLDKPQEKLICLQIGAESIAIEVFPDLRLPNGEVLDFT